MSVRYGRRRLSFAWRGFTARPVMRRRAVRIGDTRLWTIGPLAIFWGL